jgi:hypothetical protein
VKVIRSLTAVAAGCAVTFAALRGLASAHFLLSVTSTIAGALAGGFLAAWIAGGHEIPHAAGVGFAMIVLAVVSMLRQGMLRPGWYETAIAGCGPVAAMTGAAIRMLTKKRMNP